ncbi:hypothetical protein [Sphingomonas baiyangensis]|uniref:Uncharacterized protein n=1 Tax=Sphingomonas baiyangensis TaxID=2572576 RepID=A0A4U1L3A8_9SPHN|nr:hypothetical protein [Sphingomonas baiyangensis]TKD50575.1 hypothetical protein FBR43_07200 [Sphingomonas baiyangensis]
MAIINTLALAATLTPALDVGTHHQKRSVVVPAAGVANGDLIELQTFNRAGTLVKVDLAVSATLGAGATVKLAVGDGTTNVDITGATTAGGASKVNGNTIGPVDYAAGSKLYAIVGGANVSASATLRYDLLRQAS